MKTAALCGISAVFAATTVLLFQQLPGLTDTAHAQQFRRRTTPAQTVSAAETDAPTEQILQDALSDMVPPRVYNAAGLAPDEAVAAFVYEANDRSVVNIATRIGAARGLLGENPTADSGSGFVLDHRGHILTNNHVIESAQRILVTMHTGEEFEAELVGREPINDLAVVRISAPAEKLVPVRFADSSALKVGMRVFAIGNPFGLERTMTTGIISSLDRTLPVTRARSIKSVIQIDAAITIDDDPHHVTATRLADLHVLDVDAECGHAILHFRRLERDHEILVEFGDDCARCGGGREKSEEAADGVTGQSRFAHRRQFRNRGIALGTRHGERFDFAAFDERQDHDACLGGGVNLTADHCGQ